MLFNEPKLLKFQFRQHPLDRRLCFSALQRAEIAEMFERYDIKALNLGFSALQRAEIAEIGIHVDFGMMAASKFQCSSTSRNC